MSPGGAGGEIGTTSSAATSSGRGVRCLHDMGARGGGGGSGGAQEDAAAKGNSRTERRRAAAAGAGRPDRGGAGGMVMNRKLEQARARRNLPKRGRRRHARGGPSPPPLPCTSDRSKRKSRLQNSQVMVMAPSSCAMWSRSLSPKPDNTPASRAREQRQP